MEMQRVLLSGTHPYTTGEVGQIVCFLCAHSTGITDIPDSWLVSGRLALKVFLDHLELVVEVPRLLLPHRSVVAHVYDWRELGHKYCPCVVGMCRVGGEAFAVRHHGWGWGVERRLLYSPH